MFAQKLDFKIRKTNIKAKKIKSIILKTNKMIVSTFFLLDKGSKIGFFEEIFLLVNCKRE